MNMPEPTRQTSQTLPWDPAVMLAALLTGYLVLPFTMVNLLVVFFPLVPPDKRFLLEQSTPLVSWLAVWAYMSLRYHCDLPDVLALRPTRPWSYYLSESGFLIVGMLLIIGLQNLLAQTFGVEPGQPLEDFSRDSMLVITVLAIVAAPVFEEAIFRGFVQSSLNAATSRWRSMILTALIFTVFHTVYFEYPMAFVYVLTLGLLLSYFRYRTGSIIPGIVGHLFNNILATIGIFSAS